ncbi:MAG: methyltransferase domain-containing protein [bacterium]|nr:methyltransferase domain-containing protein [bacterium]
MTNEPVAQENPTRAFYDRLSKRYDALADAWEHGSREKGVEALAIGPGEEVLEIGYGTGHALEQLARAKARVVGIELSEGMRSVAAGRIAGSGLEARIQMDLGDARALPYEDDRFDAVFMSFTLELFADAEIQQVLSEAKRVLRAGGKLGIVALAEKHPPNLMSEIYVWLHEHFPHLVDCRPIDTVGHLRRAGFRIRETLVMSIWSLPVVSVVAMKPDGAWY